ncbi:MAG TPA: hypothetical protein VF060_25240 [Trebonia sp.]
MGREIPTRLPKRLPGAPATLAITGQDATRPVGLASMPGRQLPALADAFRTWLIGAAPSWDW